MPWYLYLALKQLFPSGRRVAFFTVVSVLGVMLGVMLLIIVLSVMNGFGDEIRTKIVQTKGHIRIGTGGIMSAAEYEPIISKISALPEVKAVAPYSEGIVMMQYQNKPQFPFIYALDITRKNEVVPIEQFLIVGKPDDLDDDSVFLSSELAFSLGVRVGEKVDIYSPLLLDKMKNNEVMLPRSVRVAGVFQSGWYQIDTDTVICTLRLMQDLYGLGNGVHGLGVRLKDDDSTDAVVDKLNRMLPENTRAISWLDSNRDFLFVLKLEKNVMFFLLIFIELVAAFAITSSLLIAVLRKTREIGLLSAPGAKPRQAAAPSWFQ